MHFHVHNPAFAVRTSGQWALWVTVNWLRTAGDIGSPTFGHVSN